MKTSHVWKAVTSSITTGAAAALLGTEPLAVQKLSDWSVPVNLGPLVNSASHDTYAVVSKKGLSLYFASNRPGSEGVDLWVSQRPSQDAGWGPPVNLGSHINTPFVEDAPALSRDEHWLFFDSTRPDGHGGLDHWASWRANPHDDFGWLPAVNLGAGINTPFLDAGPAPFANDDAGVPLLFFVSNRPGGLGANDIYFSQLLPDGVYDAGTRVPALNSPQGEFRPTVRFDGLEIVFGSNRPGPVPGSTLWASTRNEVDDVWSPPAPLGPHINSGAFENVPSLSPDGLSLYFNAVRPGGVGGADLHVSTRVRQTGK
jgi:hypothetical protein